MHVQFIVYVKIVLKSLNISNVFMNETHLSVFHSTLNRARETVSLPWLAMLSTRFFSLEQETLPYSRYMLWLIVT